MIDQPEMVLPVAEYLNFSSAAEPLYDAIHASRQISAQEKAGMLRCEHPGLRLSKNLVEFRRYAAK